MSGSRMTCSLDMVRCWGFEETEGYRGLTVWMLRGWISF